MLKRIFLLEKEEKEVNITSKPSLDIYDQTFIHNWILKHEYK